jgi:hypothetical protein
MSTTQKDLLIKLFGSAGPWVASVLLGFLCFYQSELISESKTMKSEIQELRIKVGRIETSMDYMTNYDLKKKN